MQLTPQDNQLMSERRILCFKSTLRLERRSQDGQNETEQPDHSANLGDSVTSSTQMRFSVHTGMIAQEGKPSLAWRLASLDHVLGDAGLSDLKPKFENQ
jgi:hypothetical protein